MLLTLRAEFEISRSGDARSLQSGRGIIDAAEGDSVIQWAMNMRHYLTETALTARPESGERANGGHDWVDIVWGILDGLLEFLLW